MEEKNDVLETPQINRFKHENNVFALAFKNEFNRLNSLNPIENETISNLVDSLNNSINSNSFMGPSPPSSNTTPTSTSSFFSNSNSNSDLISLKSAPKKSLLFRTISQNDLENNHHKQEIIKPVLNENTSEINTLVKNYPIPLFDQLSENTKNNNNKIEIKPKLVDNESSDLNLPLKTKINLKTEDSIVNNQLINNENNQFNYCDKSNNKHLNLLKNSLSKNDSILSSNSASSFEDIVTSSDQSNDKKPKKRRLIEMNTEARKEQIRSSNREAARRCRERKRNYIEYLEKKIRVLESKNEELNIENTNLKQILNDHKDCNLEKHNNFGLIDNKDINNNNITNGALVTDQVEQQQQQKHQTNEVNGIPVYLTVYPSTNKINDSNEKTKLIQAAVAAASNQKILTNFNELANLTAQTVLNFNSSSNNINNNSNTNAKLLNEPEAIQKLYEAFIASKQHIESHSNV